jgi:hypothetical protein
MFKYLIYDANGQPFVTLYGDNKRCVENFAKNSGVKIVPVSELEEHLAYDRCTLGYLRSSI